MKALSALAMGLTLAAEAAVAATGNVDIYGKVRLSLDYPATSYSFPLWSNSLTDRNGIAGSQLMFGSLLVATREECAYTPADAEGRASIAYTLRLKMADPDGVALGTVNHTFESNPLALGIAAGAAPACRFQSTMPVWYGAGIALANDKTYLVIGSVYSADTTIAGESELTWRDNSSYTIAVYNMDGSRRWHKRLTGLRGPVTVPMDRLDRPFPYQGMFNLLSKSAVGDFLGGDGSAEIRVASVKQGGNGGLTYTYSYYDLETGALIKKTGVTVR